MNPIFVVIATTPSFLRPVPSSTQPFAPIRTESCILTRCFCSVESDGQFSGQNNGRSISILIFPRFPLILRMCIERRAVLFTHRSNKNPCAEKLHWRSWDLIGDLKVEQSYKRQVPPLMSKKNAARRCVGTRGLRNQDEFPFYGTPGTSISTRAPTRSSARNNRASRSVREEIVESSCSDT